MSAYNLRLMSNVMHNKGVSDAVILKTLHTCSNPDLSELHESVQKRIALNRKISEFAEDGKICVVEGGMDCDCSAYEGHVHTFSSNLTEFWEGIERMYYNAEGPIHWHIIRPSDADSVDRSSRDLALEAFENGHAHVVYY
jgi:hypothetical protein